MANGVQKKAVEPEQPPAVSRTFEQSLGRVKGILDNLSWDFWKLTANKDFGADGKLKDLDAKGKEKIIADATSKLKLLKSYAANHSDSQAFSEKITALEKVVKNEDWDANVDAKRTGKPAVLKGSTLEDATNAASSLDAKKYSPKGTIEPFTYDESVSFEKSVLSNLQWDLVKLSTGKDASGKAYTTEELAVLKKNAIAKIDFLAGYQQSNYPDGKAATDALKDLKKKVSAGDFGGAKWEWDSKNKQNKFTFNDKYSLSAYADVKGKETEDGYKPEKGFFSVAKPKSQEKQKPAAPKETAALKKAKEELAALKAQMKVIREQQPNLFYVGTSASQLASRQKQQEWADRYSPENYSSYLPKISELQGKIDAKNAEIQSLEKQAKIDMGAKVGYNPIDNHSMDFVLQLARQMGFDSGSIHSFADLGADGGRNWSHKAQNNVLIDVLGYAKEKGWISQAQHDALMKGNEAALSGDQKLAIKSLFEVWGGRGEKLAKDAFNGLATTSKDAQGKEVSAPWSVNEVAGYIWGTEGQEVSMLAETEMGLQLAKNKRNWTKRFQDNAAGPETGKNPPAGKFKGEAIIGEGLGRTGEKLKAQLEVAATLLKDEVRKTENMLKTSRGMYVNGKLAEELDSYKELAGLVARYEKDGNFSPEDAKLFSEKAESYRTGIWPYLTREAAPGSKVEEKGNRLRGEDIIAKGMERTGEKWKAQLEESQKSRGENSLTLGKLVKDQQFMASYVAKDINGEDRPIPDRVKLSDALSAEFRGKTFTREQAVEFVRKYDLGATSVEAEQPGKDEGQKSKAEENKDNSEKTTIVNGKSIPVIMPYSEVSGVEWFDRKFAENTELVDSYFALNDAQKKAFKEEINKFISSKTITETDFDASDLKAKIESIKTPAKK